MTALTFNPTVLLDANIYLAGADLTGWSNRVEQSATAAALETTRFRQRAKTRKGGLFDMTSTIEGMHQAGDPGLPDDVFWETVGDSAAYTVSPDEGAVGGLAYLSRVMQTKYQFSGQVGELLAWEADLSGNWPLVRGRYLHAAVDEETDTGAAAGVQLGAVTATQALYVCLHVLDLSADTGSPTIAVKIQSDDNAGFTSATDRVTFTTATTTGGPVSRLVGPVTDTYWRASWTVAGGATDPSLSFVVSAGIGRK